MKDFINGIKFTIISFKDEACLQETSIQNPGQETINKIPRKKAVTGKNILRFINKLYSLLKLNFLITK